MYWTWGSRCYHCIWTETHEWYCSDWFAVLMFLVRPWGLSVGWCPHSVVIFPPYLCLSIIIITNMLNHFCVKCNQSYSSGQYVSHIGHPNVKPGNHHLIYYCTVMITIEHLISKSSFKFLTENSTLYFITADFFQNFELYIFILQDK